MYANFFLQFLHYSHIKDLLLIEVYSIQQKKFVKGTRKCNILIYNFQIATGKNLAKYVMYPINFQ